MRIRIAATTITLLLLLLVVYATRHHYEHGSNGALFRINRYTGETCRLTLMSVTPEPKAKTGNENPFNELFVKPSAPSAPTQGSSFDELLTKPSAGSNAKAGNENPLDALNPHTSAGPTSEFWSQFKPETPAGSYSWSSCGK